MEKHKEELFAEWVRSFNQARRAEWIAWLCGLFVWMIQCIFRNNSFADWIVVLIGMFFFMWLFSVSFLKSYTHIDGKNAKQKQPIWDVVYRMPFSIDAYYRVVEKEFRKVIVLSGIVIFLLMEVMIFENIAWSDYGWKFSFYHTLSGEIICKNILIGGLTTIFVTGMMYLEFYICKRRNIKYFQSKGK